MYQLLLEKSSINLQKIDNFFLNMIWYLKLSSKWGSNIGSGLNQFFEYFCLSITVFITTSALHSWTEQLFLMFATDWIPFKLFLELLFYFLWYFIQDEILECRLMILEYHWPGT